VGPPPLQARPRTSPCFHLPLTALGATQTQAGIPGEGGNREHKGPPWGLHQPPDQGQLAAGPVVHPPVVCPVVCRLWQEDRGPSRDEARGGPMGGMAPPQMGVGVRPGAPGFGAASGAGPVGGMGAAHPPSGQALRAKRGGRARPVYAARCRQLRAAGARWGGAVHHRLGVHRRWVVYPPGARPMFVPRPAAPGGPGTICRMYCCNCSVLY